MSEALAKLAELRERGFQFLHIPDADGQLDRIVGFLQRRGFIDTVLFRSEDEARAGRVPAVNDTTRPAQAVWTFEGTLVEAIDRLLGLPAPGSRFAPSLLRHSAADLPSSHGFARLGLGLGIGPPPAATA